MENNKIKNNANKNNKTETIIEEYDNLDDFIKKNIISKEFLINKNMNKKNISFDNKSINIEQIDKQFKKDTIRNFNIYINNEKITDISKKINNNTSNQNKIILNIQKNIFDNFNEKLELAKINDKDIIKLKIFSNQHSLYYMSKRFFQIFKRDIIDNTMLRFPIDTINHEIFIQDNLLLSKLTIKSNIYINEYKIGDVIVIHNINYTENKIKIIYKFIWDTLCNKNIMNMIINKIEQYKNSDGKIKDNLTKIFETLFERIFLDDTSSNIVQKKCNYYYKLLNNNPNWESNLDLISNFSPTNYLKTVEIPIQKNMSNAIKDDILIISYNEDSKKFDESDTKPIITKVFLENPKIIYVCTQESSSRTISSVIKTTHYQHILGEELKKNGYSLAGKFDASKSLLLDKNVRTRIYYKNDDVMIFNNVNTEISSQLLGEQKKYKILTKNEDIGTKGCLNCLKPTQKKINISRTKSKISGLGTILKNTLYKGSIKVKMTIRYDEYDYKIIVVNSNLFYKHDGNTGIKEREEEMVKLIEEFKLVEEWNDGYNVFFCGDLNFKIYPYNSKKNKGIKNTQKIFSSFRSKIPNENYINYNQISNNIIKNYINNNSLYKKESSNIYKKTNELYHFLQEKYINSVIIEQNFYNNLRKSIDLLGIHLTNKYKKDSKNNTVKIFKKNNLIEKVFEIREKDKYSRIPSMSDRILFSLSEQRDIKISPYNFDILLIPDKSDHKMITLSVELCNMKENKTKQNKANENNNKQNNNKKVAQIL